MLGIFMAMNIVSILCQQRLEDSITNEAPLSKILSPSNPLHRQSILPGESAYYRIRDLKPLSSYEIKISYPATVLNYLRRGYIIFVSIAERLVIRRCLPDLNSIWSLCEMRSREGQESC